MIDPELVQFVEFALSLRLPVKCSILQDRASIAAEWPGINGFKAANGYIQ